MFCRFTVSYWWMYITSILSKCIDASSELLLNIYIHLHYFELQNGSVSLSVLLHTQPPHFENGERERTRERDRKKKEREREKARRRDVKSRTCHTHSRGRGREGLDRWRKWSAWAPHSLCEVACAAACTERECKWKGKHKQAIQLERGFNWITGRKMRQKERKMKGEGWQKKNKYINCVVWKGYSY